MEVRGLARRVVAGTHVCQGRRTLKLLKVRECVRAPDGFELMLMPVAKPVALWGSFLHFCTVAAVRQAPEYLLGDQSYLDSAQHEARPQPRRAQHTT